MIAMPKVAVTNVQTTQQHAVRGMKVRASVKKMCDGCMVGFYSFRECGCVGLGGGKGRGEGRKREDGWGDRIERRTGGGVVE